MLYLQVNVQMAWLAAIKARQDRLLLQKSEIKFHARYLNTTSTSDGTVVLNSFIVLSTDLLVYQTRNDLFQPKKFKAACFAILHLKPHHSWNGLCLFVTRPVAEKVGHVYDSHLFLVKIEWKEILTNRFPFFASLAISTISCLIHTQAKQSYKNAILLENQSSILCYINAVLSSELSKFLW